MNEHELSSVLTTIHRERTLLHDPEPLRDRVAAIPTERPAPSRRWLGRLGLPGRGPLTGAVRLATAFVVVGIFGWFLFLGPLGAPEHGAVVGPGASRSPSVTDMLLGGFAIEPVEPGVVRILDDGVRDLTYPYEPRFESALGPAYDDADVVVQDDGVWLVSSQRLWRLGDERSWEDDRLVFTPSVDADYEAITIEVDEADIATVHLQQRAIDSRVLTDGSGLVASGPDGTVWHARDDGQTLSRLDGEAWVDFGAEEGVPHYSSVHPAIPPLLEVGPDGSAWVNLIGRLIELRDGQTDCDGIARFDGTTWTHYLAGQGLCVVAAAIAPDGAVWLQAATSFRDADEEWQSQEARTYVIRHPIEESSAASADEQARENDMGTSNLTRATAAATLAASLAVASPLPTMAQDEPAMPTMTEFTGTLGCGTALANGGYEFRDPDFSDLRVQGRHISRLDGYEDGDPDVDGIGAYSGLWEIVTENGGWTGEYDTFRLPPDSYSTITVRLDGYGEHQGRVAIMESDWRDDCGWDVRGVIVDGDLPEHPAPDSTS